MRVHINEELYNDLINHSLKRLPEEACGFILGEQAPGKNEELQASTFIPLRNIASNPRNRFEISPVEMLPYLMDSNSPVSAFSIHTLRLLLFLRNRIYKPCGIQSLPIGSYLYNNRKTPNYSFTK